VSDNIWDLPDLASEAVGGAAILCNDEFFAEKENLVKPHAAVWKEHEYTDRGKWMDGWETRRYRPADGVAPGRDSEIHDWCIVRLGLPGVIRGVVIDTAFFRGNYPDTAELWGTSVEDPLDLRALQTAKWTLLIPRSPLEGNAPNKFTVSVAHRFTHVRLVIYPDGGVARLRVHGEVAPNLRKAGLVDLAALEHGAVVETCSDMFFGSRNNLIKPGPSKTMADGWETRRRRGPGNDWAIIKLAGPGTIDQLEIDTSHFKGNAPALCTVEGRHGDDWRMLLSSPLQPHTKHVFESELRRVGDVSHLRLSVYPCGGVARLRAWGTPALQVDAGVAKLNAMPDAEAVAALQRCCGSAKWATAMAAARPFEDTAALLRIAERTWWSLGVDDHLEAFAAHPKIGEKKAPAAGDTKWSSGEQAGTAAASEQTLTELADAQRTYESQYGFIFIVCASGRSAEGMLRDVLDRLAGPREVELRTAAEEQAKITRLRLGKLVTELGGLS
jgi:allantoicase